VTPNARIIDEEDLRARVADLLAAADDGASGAATRADLDLMVLAVLLPDRATDRRRPRRRGDQDATPVLVLAPRSLAPDALHGREAGANDDHAEPYRLGELLAAMRALLRRRGARGAAGDHFGDFRVDRAAHRVLDPAGIEVALTRTEYELLVHLLDHRGVALDRNAILDAVWGADVVVEERTVDNFVSNLKKKLGWTAADRYRIHTVRGVGYRMEVD